MRETELWLSNVIEQTHRYPQGPLGAMAASGQVCSRPFTHRPATGVFLASETASFSPCGQSVTSRKKLTSWQFPGEPAGERGDFLSWTLRTVIQNRQNHSALESWGQRAREMWPGGEDWDQKIGWKRVLRSHTLPLEFRFQNTGLSLFC